MHLIYPVRPGDNNPELRYSLRSVQANMPEIESLTVVGYKPFWMKDVRYVPGNLHANKQQNVFHNIMTACSHLAYLAEEAVVMNDDFLVLDPVDSIATVYRGTLDDHIASITKESWWLQSLRNTRAYLDWLQGDEQAHLSYELHRPFPIKVVPMLEALRAVESTKPDNPPQWRTVYGNVMNIGGRQALDGKVYGSERIPLGTCFWSSTDISWRRAGIGGSSLGAWVADRFPKKSRWES